ncbi:Plant organelle RNA recognition domain-containing protein [Dioscorea alata]|uniref:Plant organelle RNA recognition domain-containing protein n=4 Tax=Dioscorea alata TaxID=55571 RepID=A0ACB7VCE4_DIOAL|nr:Plant organelle RNA recognition domain-containing protein [Dioscorea alata]KAH7671277.1 Plant organelle RNA recognition domain-containing protein [Dioscorea alata]KAH7671278.1 Plant organelle RNA recognition domain-containing protein [Dioscorea alata]KAH7671279.1 Plant organelle RNA recognition domain-containing protein [Dioscorea alata]
MAARLAGNVLATAATHHHRLQAPYHHHHHHLTTWSMTKDPSLESALSRNRRWIVNNQIKQILLRSPGRVSTVRSLQKRFKTLDLQGRALNWLNKYPCCFTVFTESPSTELLFGFSKRMFALIEEEGSVMEAQEPVMVRRLAKLLMLSRDHRLNVVKLNELNRSFGFPDDYLLRILPKHPNTFRIRNPIGRRNSMEIQLLRWQPELAVSAVEAVAMERGTEARFECALPLSWIKTREKFQEFNDRTPYVSPYAGDHRLEMESEEKRVVGVVHELLSLTLWKKLSIVKLEHFRREFGLPEDLRGMLLRHPCLFYVSNRYKIYTLVLREGYKGSELVEKDPLVVVKDKFGELMQEGLHEYNRRRHLVNLEKKRKKGEILVKEKKVEEKEEEVDSVEKREERKRFYKVLFDENP